VNSNNKNNNLLDKQKIVYLSSDNKESHDSQDESEEYSYITVRFKKENFEKLLSYTNYANVEAKIRKMNVEYTPEDFIKGATMYFINAMLDDIEPNNPEIIKKLYETLPEFVPILMEATKQLEDSPKQDIEQLIKNDGPMKNNIKKLMKERKMAQKELSELTGIDKSNLSIYMNNKSQPSIEFFLRIWHALEYPPLTELLYKEKST
jgi:DNA-binding Xre family transcriptional regulator